MPIEIGVILKIIKNMPKSARVPYLNSHISRAIFDPNPRSTILLDIILCAIDEGAIRVIKQLFTLLDATEINQLNFNATYDNFRSDLNGKTVLWLLTYLALQEGCNVINNIIQVLTEDTINNINFNAQATYPDSEEDKGVTLFLILAFHAIITNNFQNLNKIAIALSSKNIEDLDLNIIVSMRAIKCCSIISFLADTALYDATSLDAIIHKASYQKLGQLKLNIKQQSLVNTGVTPLWKLCQLACINQSFAVIKIIDAQCRANLLSLDLSAFDTTLPLSSTVHNLLRQLERTGVLQPSLKIAHAVASNIVDKILENSPITKADLDSLQIGNITFWLHCPMFWFIEKVMIDEKLIVRVLITKILEFYPEQTHALYKLFEDLSIDKPYNNPLPMKILKEQLNISRSDTLNYLPLMHAQEQKSHNMSTMTLKNSGALQLHKHHTKNKLKLASS